MNEWALEPLRLISILKVNQHENSVTIKKEHYYLFLETRWL